MKVARIRKRETQKLLKELEKAGFKKTKVSDGFYKVHHEEKLVFSAMIGRFDYLCRFDPEYITAE